MKVQTLFPHVYNICFQIISSTAQKKLMHTVRNIIKIKNEIINMKKKSSILGGYTQNEDKLNYVSL